MVLVLYPVFMVLSLIFTGFDLPWAVPFPSTMVLAWLETVPGIVLPGLLWLSPQYSQGPSPELPPPWLPGCQPPQICHFGGVFLI